MKVNKRNEILPWSFLLASHWLVDTEAVRDKLVTCVGIGLLDILIVLLSITSTIGFALRFLLLRLILQVCVLVLIGGLLSVGGSLIFIILFTLALHEKSKGGDLLEVFIVLGLPVFRVQPPYLENELRIEGDVAFSYKL